MNTHYYQTIETVLGNALIAEFMGAVYIPDWTSDIYTDSYPTFDFKDNHPTKSSSRFWSADGLCYHFDPEWLDSIWNNIFPNEPYDPNIFHRWGKVVDHIKGYNEYFGLNSLEKFNDLILCYRKKFKVPGDN